MTEQEQSHIFDLSKVDVISSENMIEILIMMTDIQNVFGIGYGTLEKYSYDRSGISIHVSCEWRNIHVTKEFGEYRAKFVKKTGCTLFAETGHYYTSRKALERLKSELESAAL